VTTRTETAAPTATTMPSPYTVLRRVDEVPDTVTLTLAPAGPPLPEFRPGQFAMLYAFGVGEVPISLSAGGDAGHLVHTVRAVGAVSRALCGLAPGDRLGVRGPFGCGWRPAGGPGRDLVIVAGGIGLAPLRPLIHAVQADRPRHRGVTVLIGARTPGDLLYTAEYDAWRAAGIDVLATVDRAAATWRGHVGVVTTLFARLDVRPRTATAYLCGPEVMMRFAARGLLDLGLRSTDVQVSLERNMRCAVARCGHCQLGPWLLCRDGPVVGYDRAAPLLETREL
jgi:anaerobic sulfite reductase subunit B